jgi:glyoxylate reductase
MNNQELINACQHCDALISTSSDRIDANFLSACSHLDIIASFSVGYDNIDLTAAKKHGIVIGNTPGVLVDATTDVAFGLMIAVARKMFFLHKSIEQGNWTYFRPTAHLGQDLKGKTLGVFGLGDIGFEMARRCTTAFMMPVIYHNRSRNLQAEKDLGATYVSFDELLKHSDVLSVHASLSPETKGKFDRSAFSKMKKSSIFINTARGGIHDEEALTEALEQKEIWGAGLDVTNPEPMDQANKLLQMEQVAILPHIGSATEHARNEMARLAAENILHFYSSRKIPHQVTL